LRANTSADRIANKTFAFRKNCERDIMPTELMSRDTQDPPLQAKKSSITQISEFDGLFFTTTPPQAVALSPDAAPDRHSCTRHW
ncbi:MAG: hypothetical protein ACW99G_24330, partial [Candidatus Thorarchaeota archaeon]